tara:strand:- start:119 stop:244 length:126 start_codon:yes stop_codon:yes gene_type:complete
LVEEGLKMFPTVFDSIRIPVGITSFSDISKIKLVRRISVSS